MKRKGPKFITPEDRLLHFRGWIAARGYNLSVRWSVDDRTRYIFEVSNGQKLTRGLFYAQAYAFLVGYAYGVKDTEKAIVPTEKEALKKVIEVESFDYDKRRSCSRKIPHVSKEDAYAALQSLAHKTGSDGCEVYKCRHCPAWHVGHSLRWSFV